MHLHGTTLSEQVFATYPCKFFTGYESVLVKDKFNLFWYRVNAHPNKYLHRFVPVSSFAVFMNNFDTSFKDNSCVSSHCSIFNKRNWENMSPLNRNLVFAVSTILLLTVSAIEMLNMALVVLKNNFDRTRKRKLNEFVQPSSPSLKIARLMIKMFYQISSELTHTVSFIVDA